MPSACWPPRRGLVGGISAIPAISATHTRGCMPGAWFAPGAARAISAISATRFDRRPSARKDSSTTARDNAARLRRDGAASAWLACDSRARALRPKTTDMVPNLSASVGRHTPQHCSVLSSAKRGLAADHGLGRPGLFVHRYRGSVVPEHRVTATHALPLSASPVVPGLSHVVDAKISVVSTKARRAARRDLLSSISCLSLKQGLSARACGPRSRRRELAHAIALPVIRGGAPSYGAEGEGLCRSAARFQIGSLSKIACVAFPLPALPRMTGEEKIWSRS
jgi:hypothetical protein